MNIEYNSLGPSCRFEQHEKWKIQVCSKIFMQFSNNVIWPLKSNASENSYVGQKNNDRKNLINTAFWY